MQRFRVGSNLILCIDPPPDMLEDASPWQDWVEADMEAVLLELLGQMAEILAYYQDKVANGAYLGTARTRRSIRLTRALTRLISKAALLEERLLKLLADMPDERAV